MKPIKSHANSYALKRGIVFYVNVDHLQTREEIDMYLSELATTMNDSDAMHYYIPVKGQYSDVRLIWTKND